MAVITEVAPGIFTADHQVVAGKNAIVFGTRRVLAVDTGTPEHEGQAMVDFIRSQSRTPAWLGITHGHGDHVLGGGPFMSAGVLDVFAHAGTEAGMRVQVQRRAQRTGRPAPEIGANLPWPTVTFRDEIRLDLGGRHARLFHTPGHSSDSCCVYVEEERVLISGDTVVTGIIPAFGDGDGRQLAATLRRLADLDVAVLIAGHGPPLRGTARVHDWLTWMIDYLTGVRAEVRASIGRLGPAATPDVVVDDALCRATFERCVGDRLSPERSSMRSRHRNTLVKMVQEELE